jgi:hypothetical protein
MDGWMNIGMNNWINDWMNIWMNSFHSVIGSCIPLAQCSSLKCAQCISM